MSWNSEIIQLNNDGKDEHLFWKVFKNKFLYRMIMSNMDTHLSTPYHSIISVRNMIECNQLNLLRDKVIRNQYLVFNSTKSVDSRFYKIFYAIKNDDDQDRLFYQQLFKHYGKYSLRFNNVMVTKDGVIIDNENGKEELVNEIIKTNCIPALQVLIQHYQYKPTIDNLHQAIYDNRFKFVKLLLQPQFNLQIQDKLANKIHNIKILNYISDGKLIGTQIVKENLNKIISELAIKKFPLKSLILLSKLILKCNNKKDGESNYTNILSIEKIESFSNSLNKQELKSKLSDSSNQIKSKKEMIKKLLQLCYSFSNIKKPQFYYIYFHGGTNTKSDIGAPQDENELYKSFFRFADITLASDINYYFRYQRALTESQCQNEDQDFLFSHCQDKEKQMEFLNFKIGKIKEGGELDPTSFFNSIIYNDDLDQIKYVANELGDCVRECSNVVPPRYYITNYIKSTLVLEWLFENYYSYFIVDNGAAIWYFKSVELVQHYEKLYQLKCKSEGNENSLIKLSITIHHQSKFIYYPCNINVLKHIFKSGSNVYQKETYNENDHKDGDEDCHKCHIFTTVIYYSNCSPDDKFELLKLAFLNFGGIDQLIFCQYYELAKGVCEDSSFIRFMDWVYRNYQEQINNLETLKNNSIIKTLLFNIGVYNDIDQDIGNYCFGYISSDLNECRTEHLDLIFKKIQNTDHFYFGILVSRILNYICDTGKLNTIKYIHQNYNWFLIEKSESNPNGIFTTKDLTMFLLRSLEHNQLEVSDYLFELYSITKAQFDDKAGRLSKLYYRNKSF